MLPHGVAPRRVTRQDIARRLGVSRQSLARRAAPRSPTGRRQLVGLTVVVAAATTAVTVTGSAAHTGGPATVTDAQLSSINTARIERQLRISRDTRRANLAEAQAREALAVKQAAARKAKLDAQRAQTMRRAKALAAAKKAAVAQKAAAERKAAEKEAEAVGGSGTSAGAQLPVSGYHLTARFGQGGSRWSADHTGLDFAAPMGTRVGAVLPGEVVSASYAGAYGRQVIIRHEDGTETTYCHMSEFTVSAGDTVAAGEQVGSVGATGNTTGPHLHLEVLPGGGDPIDPEPWLRDHGLNP